MGNYTPNPFMTQPAHLPPLVVEGHLHLSHSLIDRNDPGMVH